MNSKRLEQQKKNATTQKHSNNSDIWIYVFKIPQRYEVNKTS